MVTNKKGKPALTDYEVLETLGNFSLMRFRIHTGRTHQIRVHMKFIGHPLFNDEVYGGDKILKGTTFSSYRQFINNCFEVIPRHALHAKSLGFKHPVSEEDLFFDSELPADMVAVLERWDNYFRNRIEPDSSDN